MKLCPVSGCGLFHDRMLNCKVAANQLRAGTLSEPWLSANKLEELKARKATEPVEVVKPDAVLHAVPLAPSVAAPKRVVQDERVVCPVCEARRKKNREAVKKWRAKK